MEIKFEAEGLKFNVRSSCIIKDKNRSKVLVSNMRAIQSHNPKVVSSSLTTATSNTRNFTVPDFFCNYWFYGGLTAEIFLRCYLTDSLSHCFFTITFGFDQEIWKYNSTKYSKMQQRVAKCFVSSKKSASHNPTALWNIFIILTLCYKKYK